MRCVGDRNHPKRVGWFQSFLTSIWCKTSPTTNINIFLCDRPCLCWFNFGSLFGKTYPSGSDLEESWIFDWNHPISWYWIWVKLYCPVIKIYKKHFKEKKKRFSQNLNENPWEHKMVQMVLSLDMSLLNILSSTTQIEPYLLLIKTD